MAAPATSTPATQEFDTKVLYREISMFIKNSYFPHYLRYQVSTTTIYFSPQLFCYFEEIDCREKTSVL